MKKKFILIPVILALFSAVSCNVSKSDSDTSKTYKISDFSSLNLELIGDVFYEQADSSYLNVSGSSTLIEALKVSDNKGNLSIELKNKRKFTGKKKLVLRVGSPHLTKVNFESVGTLHIKNKFKSDELSINNKGVGEIIIDDCHVGNFNLTTKSIGSIEIRGTSNETYIYSEGMGKMDCSEFQSKKVKVISKGVGNLSVYAQESINISLTGIGNVDLYGNPAEVKTDISGMGKVTRVN